MRRCEDEKMRRCFTDPTIGRTLRSDALGNNEKKMAVGKINLDHINIRCPRTDAPDAYMAIGLPGCILQLLLALIMLARKCHLPDNGVL